MLELKDLRIFQKVANYGNVSKAAKDLNFVQSHVTARIQLLEAELQTQLFHRNNRGMILNPEGKKLLTYTRKILSMVDEMLKVVQDSDHPAGTLEIGTVETIIKLPMIFSAYHKKYPNVDISLVTGVTEQLVNEVLGNKLDGAFVTEFDHHPLISQHEVFQEELVLISNNETLTYEELKNRPLLVFKSGCRYRYKLENWLRDEGIISAKIMEFGTLETILGSVVAGLGVTLVPKSTISSLEAEGLVCSYSIPKKYSNITTVFILRSDSYLTNSMQKFKETIVSVSHAVRNSKDEQISHIN